jgi:hypothetical protein
MFQASLFSVSSSVFQDIEMWSMFNYSAHLRSNFYLKLFYNFKENVYI